MMQMKFLVRTFLSILSMPVFSRLWGWVTRFKHPRFLVKEIIRFYQEIYKIDMNEYKGTPGDYDSLSDFFIRQLDPDTRPLAPDEKHIVSPADGILSTMETLYEDRAIQAKGKYYAVSELIRQPIDLSEGWHLATVYLSPSDYHRFHYPVSGRLEAYCHAKGPLFPVNSLGLTLVDNLFVKNKRVICRFRVKGSPFFFVAVGATFVGSIKMEFIKKIKRGRKWKQQEKEVKQLDEMGRFEMGSTILLLFPRVLAQPLSDRVGEKVKVGDPLFGLK